MILRQSDSVALVAVCVLVALEDIHTRAASLIPVLANPAFWELDLTRHVQSIMIDRSAESSTFVQIIPIILFTGQPEARETLMTAMRSFPKNIPFFYEEELADDEIIVQRREYMEQLATFADSENYTLEEQDGVIRVHFNYPPEIENRLKKERGALETSFRSTRLTALAYSIDSNRQTDESIFVQALESEIEMENLLTSQSDKESGAVAELCAALVRKHPAWLKENGYWGWCRQKLFEAVRFHDPETGLPNPILGSLHLVAVALPSLIKNDPTDREAHELIWDLIVTAQPYPSDEAVSKLFTAIDCLWDSAPDFLWQTYNLLATRAEWLAARGSDATSPDHAVEEVQIELRAEAPRISQQSIHCAYWLAPLIAAFPRLSKRPQSASDRRILDFVDEVVRFSNKVHRQKKVKDELSQHRFVVPLEWDEPASHLLADWMLHSHFDFACERILEPTLQEWPDSPGALERLLHEVIMMAESSEHKERVIAIWKHVYNRIWPIESSQISHHELRDSARRSTYSAMVLMPEYEALNPWKSRDWNPSANLVPEFQLWVESLAHHQDYWRILIRMLHAIGKPINLPYGVNWLFETLRRCRNPNVLLNDKQVVSALSQLLIDIWHDHDSIRGDQHVFQRFIHIVDLLASRGDQMAVELQKTIEF